MARNSGVSKPPNRPPELNVLMSQLVSSSINHITFCKLNELRRPHTVNISSRAVSMRAFIPRVGESPITSSHA